MKKSRCVMMSTSRDEPLRYYNERGRLVVDMRNEGVGYMPVASRRTGSVRTSAPQMHVHPGMLEICYCLRGSLAFQTPEREYKFLPGCVFTSRDDEPHRMTANPKGLFVYRVLVTLPAAGACFNGLSSDDSAWLRAHLLALPRLFFVSRSDLREAFERLFAAYMARSADPARRRLELRRRALDVLLACVDAAENESRRGDFPKVASIVKRMERAPTENYPLGQMLAEAGLSESTFIKAFKSVAGLPPQAYLRSCRMKMAAKMLDAGSSVLATALKLKFSSAQYFATVFKAETGLSPRAWRKRSK
jgi:AraC-like DNA-binding protein